MKRTSWKERWRREVSSALSGWDALRRRHFERSACSAARFRGQSDRGDTFWLTRNSRLAITAIKRSRSRIGLRIGFSFSGFVFVLAPNVSVPVSDDPRRRKGVSVQDGMVSSATVGAMLAVLTSFGEGGWRRGGRGHS